MENRSLRATLAVGLGLALCAGLVLAQAPDWGGGGQGGGGARRGGWGGGGGGRGRGPRPGLAMLIGQEVEAKVTNTDDGVDVAVTPKDTAQIEAVQERIEGGVIGLERMAERMRENAGTRAARMGQNSVMGLLAAGDVELASRRTEDGAIISFTSEKPDVTQTLQENMTQWVADAQAQGAQRGGPGGGARWAQTREALGVLAKDEVKIEVEQVDDGIVVKITSEDEETVKAIKEKLTEYYKGQQETARQTLSRAGRGGFGGGRRGGQGGGGFGGRRRQGPPPGPPPEA